MKPSTLNIISSINNTSIIESFNRFIQINPNYSYNEMTSAEMLELYEFNTDLLHKAAELDIIDQLTFSKKNNLLSSIRNIESYLTQLPQYNFNSANRNAVPLAQALFNSVLVFADTIDNCKINERIKGFADYSNESKELAKTRKAYNSLLKETEGVLTLNKNSKEAFDSLNTKIEILNKASVELENERQKIQNIKISIESTNEIVKKNNQEIEDKKTKIIAFHNNIEEYNKSVQNLESEAKRIIAKENEINVLISQAEKALNLKSAEGISAAFSSHYSKIEDNRSLIYWIIGASIFILSAIGLTIWIVIGSNADAISAIVGRVVAVAISITGATFCAKQYIKQKNILEDYAYKSVLAKSIIAFTEEIKKRDDKKVAEYLSKVLDEIHKDPLRARDNHEDKNIGLDASEVLEKCLSSVVKK